MEAKGTRKRWTYSEFARLPESGSTRYEIIDDELVVTPRLARVTSGSAKVITWSRTSSSCGATTAAWCANGAWRDHRTSSSR